MSKKMREEELMQTHVINLNEIREAEKEEKSFKIKCLPKKIMFLGVFLIAIGIALPNFEGLVKAENKIAVNRNDNKNKITCISNTTNNGLRIYRKTTYNFDDELKSSTNDIEITDLTTTDLTNLNNIRANLLALYQSNNNIKYNIYIENNKLNIEENILNYNLFNKAGYNTTLETLIKSKVFDNTYNINEVKEEEKELGALCN